ncbi:MAG: hypothetical protein Q8K91_09495 [Hylemonella sp.]|nr:hypothetical protein [Hylemonella sp.]MDP1937422.1 hypothetical protein [Hylemonella sp.]
MDGIIDLSVALRKIHEWSMADGDLGHEYWNQIRKLLERAAGMQAEIDALREKLEGFQRDTGKS